jgi:hypothetical protein
MAGLRFAALASALDSWSIRKNDDEGEFWTFRDDGRVHYAQAEHHARHGWYDVRRSARLPGLQLHRYLAFRGEDRADLPFVVIYERYTFDGARWLRKERTEKGLWENEEADAFPSNQKFPR